MNETAVPCAYCRGSGEVGGLGLRGPDIGRCPRCKGTGRRTVSVLELLEAAADALVDQTGMVVCWHEYRNTADLLASGCPQCLVDTAIADLRRAEVVGAVSRGDA